MKHYPAEKRRFVRADYLCKIVIVDAGNLTISTHTKNIGAGGVRVVIDRDIDVQSQVGLQLFLERKTITCRGKVVWMLKIEGRDESHKYGFDTGIEFIDINQEDQGIINKLIESLS